MKAILFFILLLGLTLQNDELAEVLFISFKSQLNFIDSNFASLFSLNLIKIFLKEAAISFLKDNLLKKFFQDFKFSIFISL